MYSIHAGFPLSPPKTYSQVEPKTYFQVEQLLTVTAQRVHDISPGFELMRRDSWFKVQSQIKIIKYSMQKLQNRDCLSFSIIMFLPYFNNILFAIGIEKNYDLWMVRKSECSNIHVYTSIITCNSHNVWTTKRNVCQRTYSRVSWFFQSTSQ